MSSAGVALQRRSLTRGYSEIPNSVIENQSAFTHAELALILIVLRRGGAGDSTVTVSDRNWEGWTGLSPREKEYAVAGLKLKCLNISGRGVTARYSFHQDEWETFVRTADRSKPRTAGRKPVSPKQGSKIHPDCRDRGCALLASGNGSSAQPVAHPAGGSGSCNPVTLMPASRIAQPVAQMTDAAEQVWSKTLAALQGVFPLIGIAFLIRLLGVVRAKFAEVEDSQLAEAVKVAWEHKQRSQKGEGLFLVTVPEALAVILKRPPSPPAPDMAVGVGRILTRCIESLRARGAPFKRQSASLADLAGRVSAGVDLIEVEREMQWVETELVDIGSGLLSSAERETVAACVDAVLAPHRNGRLLMTQLQLKQLGDRVQAAETLKVLAIPRLSIFYV